MIKLTEKEIRVLGVLIEKELTTPDYYPMTINAIVNACNQTTNRNPIVHFSEDDVAETVVQLIDHELVIKYTKSEYRVAKYRHLVKDYFHLSLPQLSVLGVLLLRGPQTAGELRTRTQRMVEFQELSQVEDCLQKLSEKDEPLVKMLEKQPGQKEVRYYHLLSDFQVETSEMAHPGEDSQSVVNARARADRLEALVQTVEELRHELAEMRRELDAFRKEFE